MTDSRSQSVSDAPHAPETLIPPGFNPQPSLLAQNAWLAMMAQSNAYLAHRHNLEGLPPFQSPPFGLTPQLRSNPVLQTTSPQDIISPNEEYHIIRVLSEARRTGENHCEALNHLDGVNNHVSNIWKDHYLEHSRRFDDLVLSQTAIKEGSVAMAKAEIKDSIKSSSTKPINLKKPFSSTLSTTELSKPHSKKSHVDHKIAADRNTSQHESSSTSEDQLDIDVDTAEDENNLGEPGTSYTDSDTRLFAKHMASFEPGTLITAISESFSERYQGRSGPAWREFYRKRAAEIDPLVARYKMKRRRIFQEECGHPSWAVKQTSPGSPTISSSIAKRSHLTKPKEKRKRQKTDPEQIEKPVKTMTWKDFT